MATIPIHQPADCGVTKPLRREPHAACRPIDTTLYHASIDDGSLFYVSPSPGWRFARFVFSPGRLNQQHHTLKKKKRKKKKRVNRHRFSRLKRHLLFFSFLLPKGLWISKAIQCVLSIGRSISSRCFSFDSFVYMCVSVCCCADGEFFTDLFLFSTPLFDGWSKSYRHLFSFFFSSSSSVVVVVSVFFFWRGVTGRHQYGTNTHNWRIGLFSHFPHCIRTGGKKYGEKKKPTILFIAAGLHV